jgi:TRAP-type C4-dicarboxylate transport system substrate-binding protein
LRKVLFIVISLLVLVAIALPSCKPATPETFTWKVQVAAYPGSMEEKGMPPWEEFVEKESGGRLQIEWNYSGEVVPEDQILEATGKGILNLSTSFIGYEAGKYPELELGSGIPGMNRNPLEDMEKLNGVGGPMGDFIAETIAQENCTYLGWYWIGPYPLLATNKPINTLDDFKGMKIRAFGMFADVFAKMGAEPTYFPGSETYMALKLGTVDAVTYSIEGIDGMKWYEIMKYWVRLWQTDGIGNIWFVNNDDWAKLPDDLKDVVRRSVVFSQDEFKDIVNEEMAKNEQYAADGWYEIIDPPQTEVDKMMQIIEDTTWVDFAAISPRCAEGIQILKDWYGI